VHGPRFLCKNRALQTGPAPTYSGGDRTKKGAAMSGTQRSPAFACYRDAVTERIEAGEPFGAVEDAIDAVAELTMDQKAALWLLAFSLRDPAEQQLDARAHLAAVQ
jgi:hypothetical protein